MCVCVRVRVRVCVCVCPFSTSALPLAGNSGGGLTRLRHSSRKRSAATHSYQCVQNRRVSKQWCLVSQFEIFNVRTDVDACDCTRGLYGHRKRVCTGC